MIRAFFTQPRRSRAWIEPAHVFAAVVALSIAVLAGSAAAAPDPREWAGSRLEQVLARAAEGASPTASMPWRPLDAAPERISIWTGADGSWQRVAPMSGPHRFECSMVFDGHRQRFVVFGGANTQDFNDVWVSSTASDWTPLAVSGTPPPARRLHQAVYDAVNQRMIVFGGWSDETYELLGDVWALSLSGTPTWTELTPTGDAPRPRAGAAATYDPVENRMLVLGGFADLGTFTCYTDSTGVDSTCYRDYGLVGDVCALSLDGTPEWTSLAPTGAAFPPRFGATAVYDAVSNSVLAHGGTGGDSMANGVWRLALGSAPDWSVVATAGMTALPRSQHVAAYDPGSRHMLVFGGYNDTSLLDDVWMLDCSGTPAVWSDVTPAEPPFPRWSAAAAMTNSGTMYVFGGLTNSFDPLADTWSISVVTPVSWTFHEDLMPPRLQISMVMDTQRHRMMAFGGTDGQYRNDTWVRPLDTGRGWTQFTTFGAKPAARRLQTMVYDPDGDRLIMYGGFNDAVLGDVWQLPLGTATPTWAPLATAGTPPTPRAGHTAIYDPVGHRMIVYAGWIGPSSPSYRIDDVWALSLTGTPTWTQLSTNTGPGVRSSHTAVYDELTHSMLVFAGTTPTFLDDTWRLTLTEPYTWSPVLTSSRPGVREEQTAAFDPHRNRMVIFGGYDQYILNYGDLWSLDLAGTPDWTTLAADGDWPEPRWGAKALYDTDHDGMWMYGGWGGRYLRDLWFLQWSDPPAEGVIATDAATTQSQSAVLEWRGPGFMPSTARIERSTDGVHWAPVAVRLPSLTGHYAFADHGVLPGGTYAWRTSVTAAGRVFRSNPVWLTIPAAVGAGPGSASFALRPASAASRPGRVAVACSLPRAGSARVDLLDVTGRRLDSRALSASAPGTQRVELGSDLASGLYFVQLRSGNDVARLKQVIVR